MIKESDILLVEDNPRDADLVMRSFKKAKLANDMVWLKDGQECLDYLFREADYSTSQRQLPRVILLDLKMPKLNGIDVLKEIRSNEITKFIPVVILTSSKEERDIYQSYELNVNSYIVKPVNFDDFMNVVSQMGLYWLLINEPPIKKISKV